jgi:glutaminyl-peptide cyclotransferase
MELRHITISFFFFISLFLLSCPNSSTNENNSTLNRDTVITAEESIVKLIFETIPSEKKDYKIGEIPEIKISLNDSTKFDSIEIFIDKKQLITTKILPLEIKISEKTEKPCIKNIEAYVYKNGAYKIQKFPVTFLSDIAPKTYSYEIVKVYPHDTKAYTQGLVFDNGFFYESTGLKGESTLRKVQLSTGDPIQSITLDSQIFGEGISIFNDKIIQLSWQNNVGFVYDKKTFQLLAKFNYPTEGWGLTNDGKNLIMSDGTNKLYFLEPQSYSEIGRIEVYDNKGPVDELNELEYINDEVYANIYRTDKIARIDPKTGKVLAYIDLSKLLPTLDFQPDTDVLNGIAFDVTGKRLFVTGKKWPKLFEIKIRHD